MEFIKNYFGAAVLTSMLLAVLPVTAMMMGY